MPIIALEAGNGDFLGKGRIVYVEKKKSHANYFVKAL